MTLASRFWKYSAIAALGIGALCATTWRAEAGAYVQTNLVSNIPGLASITDPDLKNPWGISHSATSPFWISDQGANVSTLYNVTSSGVSKVLTNTVPIPTTGSGPQGPTGQVTNLTSSGTPAAGFLGSRFIFANLNGTISAWFGVANVPAVIEATTPGHVYTGLAVNDAHTRLYAANDAGATGSIDVFNSSFAPDTTLPAGAFATPAAVSALNLVPFNVQDIGGKVYVTYAPSGLMPQRNATSGQGAVVVFDEDGKFLQTLILGSELASPWGVTLAPSTGFGPFSGDLLVGNFSFVESEINAFDPVTGALAGTIPVDVGAGHTTGGLWALAFGNAGNNGNPTTLFFNDGINGEADGLFAQITFVPEPSSLALLAAAFGLFAVRRSRVRR